MILVRCSYKAYVYFMKQNGNSESEVKNNQQRAIKISLLKLNIVKEFCYLGAITWIPKTTTHCDDIVLKVAVKNYSLNTLSEENI